MKINILTDKISWFGRYSGYECLTNYLPENYINATFNASKRTLVKRITGKYYQYATKQKSISTFKLSTGINFLTSLQKNRGSHILYLDSHTYLLDLLKDDKSKSLIGTIHLPFNQWRRDQLLKLKKLKNPIILYESEIEKFQKYLPDGRIKFIRHGVDNSFFKPGSMPKDKTKILYVGHYLRNFEMLYRVISLIIKDKPQLTFHLVLPGINRNNPALLNLSKYPSVYFYENLKDDELLKLYQTCYLMLMPMNDSGANTAIIQGIACGIPIVTTNNGGIASYGGNTIFPLVENNDDSAMVDLIHRYLDDEQLSADCSLKLRNFSLEYLDWKIVAHEHLRYYQNAIEYIN
jgi:glycosyltransferase involved in cell wall biosynthesis